VIGLVGRRLGLPAALAASAAVFAVAAPGFVLLGRVAQPAPLREAAGEAVVAVPTKVSPTPLG